MKKYFSKEVKIAISVIVSAVILYFGIEFLKGINLMQPSNYYYIKYDNVAGLTVSTPVTVDGFKVGLVRSIDYDYETYQGAVVEVMLDKKLRIPEGSKAVLQADLLGTVTLTLQLNKYVSTYCSPGDYLVGESDAGLMNNVEEELLPSLAALLPKIDSLLDGLNGVVRSQELNKTLTNVAQISDELRVASHHISTLLADTVPAIVSDVKRITHNLDGLTAELSQSNIKQTIAHIDGVVASVDTLMAKLHQPDNTVGALLTDRALYDALNRSVTSADSLLIDLRLNPKRYVHFSLFGGKK
ncbi:MAG TPA: MCE family protein [Candidatus Caccoplasma merdavium]|nr:MCE family protein [Candidatus Caccoplasma merdavium]